jgi:hypothetical protein
VSYIVGYVEVLVVLNAMKRKAEIYVKSIKSQPMFTVNTVSFLYSAAVQNVGPSIVDQP